MIVLFASGISRMGPEQNKVTKSFVASKEAIKAMIVTEKYIFVAGCDPIIRGFSLETGECKLY
jgi:hypothetical protein